MSFKVDAPSKRIRVDYASVDDFLADYEENIAQGAVVIRSSQQMQRGQELVFTINFPGLLQPLQLEGRVQWVEEAEAGAEPAFGIAIPAGEEHPQQLALRKVVRRIRQGDAALLANATLRVLVVEDNPHLADLIQRGLEAHLQRDARNVAFQIHRAADGLAGIKELGRHPFELLLVDIFLPDMSGDELIRVVRADDKLKELPIIALSAAEDAEQQAMEAGANIFLAKPVRLNELLQAMRRLNFTL